MNVNSHQPNHWHLHIKKLMPLNFKATVKPYSKLMN